MALYSNGITHSAEIIENKIFEEPKLSYFR